MWTEVGFQVLAALVVATSATPHGVRSRHVLHEKREVPAASWTKFSRVPPSVVLPVRIGLTQQNLHRAEEFILDVSHPTSSNYGKHWSPERIAKTFSPASESVDAVKEWLSSSGINLDRVQMSKSGNWMTFNATTSEAEDLLRTEYHLYQHAKGNSHIACEEYSLPSHIREHIDIITPTIHFDQQIGQPRPVHTEQLPEPILELNKRSMVRRDRLGSPNDFSNPKQGHKVMNALMSLDNCDTMITPACLQALYKIPEGSSALKGNAMGVVEYTPQAFLQSDLDMFFQEFQPKLNRKSPIINLIDGAVLQTQNESFSFNGESGLDLEFAMALIYPQQVSLYQVGDLVEGGSFNNFLDSIDGSYCTFEGGDDTASKEDAQYPDPAAGGFKGPENCGGAPRPNVVSTSYGSNEADLSPAYAQRQCLEYMKLGLQGVSVLYSSGDFGVAGNGGQCIDDATGQFNSGTTGRFNPSFPGGCPYVTSVGATQIQNGSTVLSPESASEQVIFSGGGFSNVFPMPSYQKQAQATYFAAHAPPYTSAQYNNSGLARGYPDVSANGVNYVTAVDGEFSLSFGTSASCPTFASVLTLINEQRLRAGKSSIGFINPILYANPGVLNDITTGGNQGCGTAGFESVSGWDPVTGLGTPNYPAMLKLFMSLP